MKAYSPSLGPSQVSVPIVRHDPDAAVRGLARGEMDALKARP
jgi:hypothetical protein